jgi:hypothetical protein
MVWLFIAFLFICIQIVSWIIIIFLYVFILTQWVRERTTFRFNSYDFLIVKKISISPNKFVEQLVIASTILRVWVCVWVWVGIGGRVAEGEKVKINLTLTHPPTPPSPISQPNPPTHTHPQDSYA